MEKTKRIKKIEKIKGLIIHPVPFKYLKKVKKDLDKVSLSQETVEKYLEVFEPDKSFWDRARAFLAAENQAGRIASVIKDFALTFIPYGRTIDNATDFFSQRIALQPKKEKPNNMFNWIIDRLQERSTWKGLIVAATAAGAIISPEAKEAIMAAGASIFALIDILDKSETESK